jgi:hypothetical protein
MSVLDMARRDLANRMGNPAEFAVPIVLISPSNASITVNGIHRKIHLAQDTDGNYQNVMTASVTISYTQFGTFPYRNSNDGEVKLLDYKVNVTDASGLVRKYKVIQQMPDETLGCVILQLANRKDV